MPRSRRCAERKWSVHLTEAAAAGLTGGGTGLRARLPGLPHPLTAVGTAAAYFSERYGIPADAAVRTGRGLGR